MRLDHIGPTARRALKDVARGRRITNRAVLRELEALGLVEVDVRNYVPYVRKFTPSGLEAISAIGKEVG